MPNQIISKKKRETTPFYIGLIETNSKRLSVIELFRKGKPMYNVIRQIMSAKNLHTQITITIK